MGREIRMVAADWKHPRTGEGLLDYRPVCKLNFQYALNEWELHREKYEQGLVKNWWGDGPEWRPDNCNDSFEEYYGEKPEDPGDYMPDWSDNQRTHFQLYETVSEGTPVSPVFATAEELAQYLADNGDFWFQHDQSEGKSSFRTKPSYEQALNMVNSGHAFSLIVKQSSSGTEIQQPHEQFGV